jgi:hypothetical protein
MGQQGGDEAAQAAAAEALEDAALGTLAGAQTEGQIEHPHGSDNHTDSWSAEKQEDGSVKIEKEHT